MGGVAEADIGGARAGAGAPALDWPSITRINPVSCDLTVRMEEASTSQLREKISCTYC